MENAYLKAKMGSGIWKMNYDCQPLPTLASLFLDSPDPSQNASRGHFLFRSVLKTVLGATRLLSWDLRTP